MKRPLLLPVIAAIALPILYAQTPDASQVVVLSFKWSKGQQNGKPSDGAKPIPAAAMTQSNKNFDRNMRGNDPAGVRHPDADTVDTRSAALEKSVQSAESSENKVDGFAYHAKIQNASKQAVEIVFWEYQFINPANPGEVTRRQFLCGVNIKPGKEKELLAFASTGPPNTVDANSPGSAFQEQAVINRVEFTDGKSWMRKDWNANEIKAGYQRAMATPWAPNEICRAL